MKAGELAVKALTEPKMVRTSLIIALFTKVFEEEDAWKKDPYLYRIVTQGGKKFYVNEKKELSEIELKGDNVITPTEKVFVTKKQCANLEGDSEVYFGELLVNYIILVQPFGGKIPFQKDSFSFSKVEDIAASRLASDIDGDEGGKKILTSELDRYYDACKYFEVFARIFNFSSSEVIMSQAPGSTELKEKLLKGKYKDNISNTISYIKFEKEMQDHDDKYIETDPYAKAFVKGKIKNVSRRKSNIAQGIEPSLGDKSKTKPITRSLNDGWGQTPEELADNMNISVYTSFSKGWLTRVAGQAGKVLIRAMNSFEIVDGDCGTKTGLYRKIDKHNNTMFVGIGVKEGSTWAYIKDIDEAKKLDGFYVTRSSAYCKKELPQICSKCAGKYLSLDSSRASSASADIAAALLMLSMKAVHSSTATTTKYDLDDAFILS